MVKTEAKYILVVEDDPGIFELMEIVLEGAGYLVSVCADGQNVQPAVKQNRPNLILLDLWIPGLDGKAITKLLKSDLATKQIPIIIVSAQNNLSEISKQIGADGFLTKPFDLDLLLQTVKKYI